MSDFNKNIKDCRNLVELQGLSGNWDCDEYMHGMFNGMELILSIMEEREPEYREAPDRFKKYVKPFGEDKSAPSFK